MQLCLLAPSWPLAPRSPFQSCAKARKSSRMKMEIKELIGSLPEGGAQFFSMQDMLVSLSETRSINRLMLWSAGVLDESECECVCVCMHDECQCVPISPEPFLCGVGGEKGRQGMLQGSPSLLFGASGRVDTRRQVGHSWLSPRWRGPLHELSVSAMCSPAPMPSLGPRDRLLLLHSCTSDLRSGSTRSSLQAKPQLQPGIAGSPSVFLSFLLSHLALFSSPNISCLCCSDPMWQPWNQWLSL